MTKEIPIQKPEIDYHSEKEKITEISKLTLELLEVIRTLAPRYTPSIKAAFAIEYGRVPQMNCDCPYCHEKMNITIRHPLGGLNEALEDLKTAYDLLDVECTYEDSPTDHPCQDCGNYSAGVCMKTISESGYEVKKLTDTCDDWEAKI